MRHVVGTLCALAVLAIAAPARASSIGGTAGLYTSGAPLPVAKGEVRVTVDGAFADVVVTQTFRNDLERGIEAVYVFPLPADAAVRSMEIRTGDRTITAKVARREEARRAYEDAVSQGVVAALTEEERANIFTQQVTGIAAGAEVEVELRFDMTVGRWRDGWELALPLVVAPRHVAGVATGDPTHGTGTAPDTDEVDDASRVTPPVRADGGGNPITAVIDVGDVEIEDLEVPSHDASVRRQKARTVATIKDLRSDRDLVVRWTSADAGDVHAVAERSADGGVVAVVVEAPRPASSATRERRRWLMVLDVSGSMDGSALVLLRDAANALIDRIGNDQLAILGPAGGSLKWRRGDRGLALARKTVDTTDARGGTALGDLLGTALASLGDGGDDVAIVVITDGLVADDAATAARVDGARARVHTIGVGSAPNRWLLDELARRGRGASAVLGAGDDVEAAVADLVAVAGAPTVTPTIDWGGLAVREVAPGTLPAMAAGRSLVVAAHLDRLADARITVYAGDHTFEARITEEGAGSGDLVGRRWARTRVDELIAGGGSSDEVTRLGLAYGLVTPYTALVARGEEVTVQGGVRTTVAIPVAMPAGMRWQSVFGSDGDVGETLVLEDPADGRDHDDGNKQPRKDKEKEGKTDVAKAEDRGGAGAGGDDDSDEEDEAPTMAPAPPGVDSAGSTGGSYEAQEIMVRGSVIQHRGGWSGSVSMSGGLHLRRDDAGDAERAPAAAVTLGAYRAMSPRWELGVSARLQNAAGVDGGLDGTAYVAARRFLTIGGLPLLAVDGGAGLALDESGVAWRLGVRLGWWRIAPVFGVDQTYAREVDGWTPRTTVGAGVELRF